MKEVSKSSREYAIPLIIEDDVISAYDIIQGSENFVFAIDPSLITGMVALFHNHPSEIKVILSIQDIIIFNRFNIPLIIGGKKEIKLFEIKPNNTLKNDLEELINTQSKLHDNLSLGKHDEELRNKFRNLYEKTISNFDIRFIYIEK
jgi:hypothetical protein